MNLFISGCRYLWFLYILHREICLMTDNYNGIIVSRNKRQKKHCLDFYFFFFFKINNGIQKHRSRQLSDGNQFKILLLVPFSPLEGIKGHLFCVTNLSPVYAQVTRRGGSWGMRMDVSPVKWPCQICRAWEPLFSWCLNPPCPNRVPLPLGPSPITQFWVSLNPKSHHHCRAQRTQLSIMEGMFPGRLGCPLLKPQV